MRKATSWLTVVVATIGRLAAHDPGLSSSHVVVGAQAVVVEAAFANADLALAVAGVDTDRDGRLSAAEVAAGAPALDAFARGGLVLALDGEPAMLAAVTVALVDNEDQDVGFGLRFAPCSGQRLEWRIDAIGQLARGHRHWCSLADDRGRALGSALLSAQRTAMPIELDAARSQGSFDLAAEFAVLGVEHIWIGYDHILFLLALLAAGRGFWSAARVITAFTLAHSLTLAAASLGVVHLPGELVEPAIALSIIYVGLENVVCRTPRRRELTTFAFGLLHGFGFASVLAERGLGDGSVVLPLAAFNAGVEFGQLTIAGAALPLLWLLQRRPWFAARLLPLMSLAVTAAGLYWLVERL